MFEALILTSENDGVVKTPAGAITVTDSDSDSIGTNGNPSDYGRAAMEHLRRTFQDTLSLEGLLCYTLALA